MVINGKQFAFWDDLELHRGLDSHASVGFKAPFEAERKEFRETFKPFSYFPLDLLVGDEKLFTGTLVDVNPSVGAAVRSVECSAYSKPAGLDDSDVPVSLLPIEANGLSLKQIASRLCEPYGISVVVDGPEGGAFKRVKTRQKRANTAVEADEKIGTFLAELGRQRGYVMSSTAKGELHYVKSVEPGRPVARFEHGVQPMVEVVPTFNPQEYYSEITGFTTGKRGRLASKYTERNQRLAGGAVRAMSFKLNDVDKADAPAVVKAKMGRMFANALTIVVNVPTWRDPSGKLWSPNTTVTLSEPNAFIYNETEFLVRDVYLKQNAGAETASLGLVLPGAFSGEAPPKLPWD